MGKTENDSNQGEYPRDMIKETFPTHGDKEIIFPTMEAIERGVTKGNLSLKTLKADNKAINTRLKLRSKGPMRYLTTPNVEQGSR